MSISVASYSLYSIASKGVNQPASLSLGRLVTSFQSPRYALPALVVSTVIGAICGLFAALLTYGIVQEARSRCSEKASVLVMIAEIGCSVCISSLTVAGVNVATSKLLKLPFSRSSSLAITLATLSAIVLGLLWGTGILDVVCQRID